MALSSASSPSVGTLGTASWADIVAADVNDYIGDWTTYTATLGSTGTTPTIGSGGLQSGIYKLLGNHVCAFSAQLTWGTSGTAGTGAYTVALPVAWANDGVLPSFAALYLTAGGTGYSYIAFPASTTTIEFLRGDATTGFIGGATPAAHGSGDRLIVSGTYHC